MTNEQIEQFIQRVYLVATEHPEIQGRVTQAFQHGVNTYINTLKEQVSDMETVAVAFSVLAENKGKGQKANLLWANKLILSKLKKHQGNTAFINWTSNIEECEAWLKNEGII